MEAFVESSPPALAAKAVTQSGAGGMPSSRPVLPDDVTVCAVPLSVCLTVWLSDCCLVQVLSWLGLSPHSTSDMLLFVFLFVCFGLVFFMSVTRTTTDASALPAGGGREEDRGVKGGGGAWE